MAADDYEQRARALGIDRGKLATGFKDSDVDPAPASPAENIEEKPKKPVTKPDSAPVEVPVNNSVNKCRCGTVISLQSKRCRKCFQIDNKGKPRKSRRNLLPPTKPSPPVPPVAPAEVEPQVIWSLLGQPEIEKIARAVIIGNGGMAHEEDIIAAVEELCRYEVGSILCTLVLEGHIGIQCRNRKVSYTKLDLIGQDWDYVI